MAARFSSPAVITALQEASDAGLRWEWALKIWQARAEEARTREARGQAGRPDILPPGPRLADSREAAGKALTKANDLDDRLMAVIRAELHARASQAPAPPVSSAAHHILEERTSEPGHQRRC